MSAEWLTMTGDLLASINPDILTWTGLVGFVVVSFVRGWLVAGTQVARMDASYRKQIDDLVAANNAKQAQVDMLLSQQQRLLEIAYLTRDAATRRLEGMSDEMA